MQAIIDACKSGELDMEPVVVISNNSNSATRERAAKAGIDFFHISSVTNPEDEDGAMLEILTGHQADIIILAGYMKKIGPKTLAKYRDKILNIHPALLPDFGGPGMYGMNVHKAVIKAGVKESGATVHLIDEKYDHGKILVQRKVNVDKNDTPESLQKKVLALEHKIYIEALKEFYPKK